MKASDNTDNRPRYPPNDKWSQIQKKARSHLQPKSLPTDLGART